MVSLPLVGNERLPENEYNVKIKVGSFPIKAEKEEIKLKLLSKTSFLGRYWNIVFNCGYYLIMKNIFESYSFLLTYGC